jgi:hypothetical protein
MSRRASRSSRLQVDGWKCSHTQLKAACASEASEHNIPLRGNTNDETQKSGPARPNKQRVKIRRETAGVTTTARPEVLFKQRSERRGVEEAQQQQREKTKKKAGMQTSSQYLGHGEIPGKANPNPQLSNAGLLVRKFATR